MQTIKEMTPEQYVDHLLQRGRARKATLHKKTSKLKRSKASRSSRTVQVEVVTPDEGFKFGTKGFSNNACIVVVSDSVNKVNVLKNLGVVPTKIVID